MADPISNDNDAAPAGGHPPGPDPLGPDAHGQAAMLLVESLIHGLVARSVISVGDAVEIVDIAADVKEEVAEDIGDTSATKMKSLAMLEAIRTSLGIDLTGDDAKPWPPLPG